MSYFTSLRRFRYKSLLRKSRVINALDISVQLRAVRRCVVYSRFLPSSRTSDHTQRRNSSKKMSSTGVTQQFNPPMFGLGLWKVPKESCATVVYGAIKMGVRHLDCACDYGNEVEVGEG